jgi:hypothetical protein
LSCLTPSAQASLKLATKHHLHPWHLAINGNCGRCGAAGHVFDIAYVLVSYWKGELYAADGSVALAHLCRAAEQAS